MTVAPGNILELQDRLEQIERVWSFSPEDFKRADSPFRKPIRLSIFGRATAVADTTSTKEGLKLGRCKSLAAIRDEDSRKSCLEEDGRDGVEERRGPSRGTFEQEWEA